ncbi:MAG: hypothetical protein J3R72DRAFT_437347 [Linnemannia gamsii]|nr:MAG: hypothetical protein J3R72DRAFT_437347 [Linnemannia gamsii]
MKTMQREKRMLVATFSTLDGVGYLVVYPLVFCFILSHSLFTIHSCLTQTTAERMVETKDTFFTYFAYFPSFLLCSRLSISPSPI